jgi:hypothetical protein
VTYLTTQGIGQFLDIGSGVPTAGSVHQIAQAVDPQARVVYVDIDPVAVCETLDLLDGNPHATAIRADLTAPLDIAGDPRVRRLLNLTEPVGLLLVAVLHFIPDDQTAIDAVRTLTDLLPAGSYLAVSHAAAESFPPDQQATRTAQHLYAHQTATPGKARTRNEVARFLHGTRLCDPGLVWTHQWKPDSSTDPDFVEAVGQPQRAGSWAGVGQVTTNGSSTDLEASAEGPPRRPPSAPRSTGRRDVI